jgi:hypothetical protein
MQEGVGAYFQDYQFAFPPRLDEMQMRRAQAQMETPKGAA